MRAPIAYYTMLLYFTVMFKPFIPIVKDVISHTFAEAIHIATVHAIYGSNHLQKELADTSDNTNNKHQTNTNGEEQVQVHVSASEFLFHFCCLTFNKNYSVANLCQVKAGFIIKYSPPPKFS
jgi:hypothetical protein